MKMLMVLLIFIMPQIGWAVPLPAPGPLFTYEGVLTDASGTPITAGQTVNFQIIDSGTCVVYEETQSISPGTQGEFSVRVGEGTRTDTTVNTIDNFFSVQGTVDCAGTGPQTVSGAATRSLRITVGATVLTPDVTITNVPYAINAYKASSSEKLGTNVASDFLLKAGLPTCGAGTFLTWDGTGLSCAAVPAGAGGTVTTVTSTNAYLSVVNGTLTPALTVNVGSTAGTLAAGDDARFTSAIQSGGAAGGALSGTYPSPGLAVNSVSTGNISNAAVTTAKLFLNPGVNRLVATDSSSGATLAALGCATGQLLTWTTSGWSCTNQSAMAVGSASTSGNFSGSLLGDVTGTQSATVVSKIAGYPVNLATAPTTSQVLSWNGTNWVAATVAVPPGGVTSVSSVNSDIGVATGTTTPVLTLNSGTAAGQIVKLDAAAKLPAVDGSQLTNFLVGQIPNLDAAKITSGVFPISKGGTGNTTYTDGQLLIGNTVGNTLTKANLTAGSGITIVNGNGSIMISNTGPSGTVTNVAGTAPINVATGTSTPVVSLVAGIVAGQVHRWDGTSWAATKLSYTDLVNSLAASPWPIADCAAGQAITWSSASDGFVCTALSIPTSQITGTLPVAQIPDLPSYAKLAGRSLGQVLNGGIAANENLTLESTSDVAKGFVLINPSGGNVGIGVASPAKNLHLSSGSISSTTVLIENTGTGLAEVQFKRSALPSWAARTDALGFSIYENSGTDNNRMTVKPGGSVGIGTPLPEAKLDIVDSTTGTSAIIVPRAANFTGTPVNGMIRYNTASALFEFYQNGLWVKYTTVSDGRLKTNVVSVSRGLDIVNQLNPVFFDWDKNNPRTHSFGDQHQVGFIAQEVEKVLPEVVNKGEDSYRSVEYGKIVAVAIAAVKELYRKILGIEAQDTSQNREIASVKTDIESSAAKIAALQAENTRLKQRVKKAENESAAIKSYLCGKDSNAEFCH